MLLIILINIYLANKVMIIIYPSQTRNIQPRFKLSQDDHTPLTVLLSIHPHACMYM